MKTLYSLILFPVLIWAGSVNAQTAELQVIHNASDPGASEVDVYVNGTLAIDDFAFRTATSFLTLPSGVNLQIGIAPGNSTSITDTLTSFNITLADGNRYVAIANGVLDPSQFSSNPDGNSTAFTLLVSDNIRNMSVNAGEIDFIAVHGATDAPAVDIDARNVATLVTNASYTDITNYISVPASSYLLDVKPAGSSTIVASFLADLSAAGGASAVVFASGFLDSAANQNGAAFGLFAALADGTVIQFPQTSLARLQVIHNAADPLASSVDVYLNGILLLDNFDFRTATPYVDVPADVLLQIGVAPSGSTSVTDTIANFDVILENGKSYAAIANGVLNPSSFSMNPDMQPTAFTLFLTDGMREASLNPAEVDLRVVHGATDAPEVDVLTGSTILVDNAVYSNITGYLSVPPAQYTLDITPGNNNSNIVASFNANLSTLGGGSAIVLASGFLDPSSNQNGAAFSLIAVLPDGTVITLGNITDVKEITKDIFQLYPNPASNYFTINLDADEKTNRLIISNLAGELIIDKLIETNTQGSGYSVKDLPSGMYFVKIENKSGSETQKLIVE